MTCPSGAGRPSGLLPEHGFGCYPIRSQLDGHENPTNDRKLCRGVATGQRWLRVRDRILHHDFHDLGVASCMTPNHHMPTPPRQPPPVSLCMNDCAFVPRLRSTPCAVPTLRMDHHKAQRSSSLSNGSITSSTTMPTNNKAWEPILPPRNCRVVEAKTLGGIPLTLAGSTPRL